MFSWYGFQIFFTPYVTIAVAPVITGITIQFMFRFRCISTHKPLYCSFFIIIITTTPTTTTTTTTTTTVVVVVVVIVYC
jgi:hypothetical protein